MRHVWPVVIPEVLVLLAALAFAVEAAWQRSVGATLFWMAMAVAWVAISIYWQAVRVDAYAANADWWRDRWYQDTDPKRGDDAL